MESHILLLVVSLQRLDIILGYKLQVYNSHPWLNDFNALVKEPRRLIKILTS